MMKMTVMMTTVIDDDGADVEDDGDAWGRNSREM